jgi:uncharacterized membrane protein
MNKQIFMSRMGDALARLKPEERRDILADFEEHFAGGTASGKTEEEVARELGDPVALAQQYTEGLPDPPAPVKASGVLRGILAGFGLLLFDLMIALPVIAALFAVWVSLWSVVLAIFCVALACFVAPFLPWLSPATAMAGAGVFLIGISMLALTALAAIGMAYVTKYSFKGLAAYVMAHVRIIRGGSKG